MEEVRSGKEFLARLEALLWDLPQSDREDALAYYADYFAEAGPEQEARVLQELGSPKKVADMIKSEHKQDSEEAFERERELPAKKDNKTAREGRKFPWALVIVLVIFASPVLLGGLGGVLGVIFGILAAIFGCAVALLAAVAVGIIGGLALIVVGIAKMFISPAAGMLCMGVGAILIAIGLLVLIFSAWLLFKALPAVIRFAADMVRRLVKKIKGGTANE